MNQFHYNIVGNKNHKRLFVSGTSALIGSNAMSGIAASSPNIGLVGDRDICKSRSNKVLLSPLKKPNSSPKVKSVMKIRTDKEMT